VASEYALLLAALGQDLASLRAIQSVERKIQAKSGMIGRYRAWVAGALASDPPVQDDIVGTMLVWAIDIGDWPLALELGDHVLAANLGLPERYKRSPAVLLAEEIAESALRVATAVPRAVLEETLALTADHDMPDQVRAKLHKALGLAFQAEAEAFDPEAESQRAGGKRALVDAALDHTSRARARPARGREEGDRAPQRRPQKAARSRRHALTPPRSRRMRHPRRGERSGKHPLPPRALTPTPWPPLPA
jgi:hypothetical protein